ncbi:MAG: hypothetical protein QOI63_1970, partial [Thermoplasmata archaeon]|nr:hypothetical protein [Thermoplasmata archaeon]
MYLETECGVRLPVGSHQSLAVMDEAGSLVWRPAGELRPHDHVLMDLGSAREAWARLPLVELEIPPQRAKPTRVHPRFPLVLDEEMARLAGLYVGNGHLDRNGIYIAVCDDDPDMVAWLANFWLKLGVNARFKSIRHCVVVAAHCTEAVDRLVANDIHKQGADPGSASAHVPEGIMRSPLRVV